MKNCNTLQTLVECHMMIWQCYELAKKIASTSSDVAAKQTDMVNMLVKLSELAYTDISRLPKGKIKKYPEFAATYTKVQINNECLKNKKRE